MKQAKVLTMNLPERPFNIDEALDYLAAKGWYMTKRTFYNKLYLNEGPASSKRGNRLTFKKTDLDRWDEQNAQRRNAYTG